MNTKAFLPIVLILSVIVALPISTMLPTAEAQAKPSVFISPPNNVFTTDTTAVGSTFTVTINASDWPTPGVFSFEFKLYYDKTLLEPVPAQTGIPANAWITTFLAANGTVDPSGFVYESATLLGTDTRIGSGLLGVATFKILKEPAAGRTLTCSLSLQGNATSQVIIVNPDTSGPYAADYYTVTSGNFKYVSSLAGPPLPIVYVDPQSNIFFNTTASVGTNFNVSVKTVNWTSPGVFGYAFKLSYNSSLLQATNVNLPDDHFLEPANASNIVFYDPGTINQTAGYVSFNASLLDGEQGKTGAGTILTVTFNITLAPPPDGSVSCILDISNIIIIDPNHSVIPTDQYEVVNGSYSFSTTPKPTPDLNGDGKVSIEDIAILAQAFGSVQGQPRFNPRADENGDKVINILDAVILAIAWTG
jgi:hypothetical protein